MEKLAQTLSKLGFSDKEAAIYLALLELGTGTIQEISKKSSIKRTNIYNLISGIKQKGLISEVRHDKKTIFVPASPEVLSKMADDKARDFKSLLPEFLAIFNTPNSKPKVTFYEGIEGIKKSYSLYLNAKGPIYAMADVDQMMAVMDNEYMWKIAQDRADRGIKYYAIIKDGTEGRKAKSLDTKQLRESRLAHDLNFSTEINIFDDKVLMVSFKRPFSAIIIENSSIADTLRVMWRTCWKNLK